MKNFKKKKLSTGKREESLIMEEDLFIPIWFEGILNNLAFANS